MTQYENVCLIDNDNISNFIHNTVIKNCSFTKNVYQFTNVSNALSFLKEILVNDPDQFPEIIFLDINLPFMNGWDFLEEFESFPEYAKEKCTLFLLSHFPLFTSFDNNNLKNYKLENYCINKPLTAEKLKTLFEAPVSVS